MCLSPPDPIATLNLAPLFCDNRQTAPAVGRGTARYREGCRSEEEVGGYSFYSPGAVVIESCSRLLSSSLPLSLWRNQGSFPAAEGKEKRIGKKHIIAAPPYFHTSHHPLPSPASLPLWRRRRRPSPFPFRLVPF